MAAAGSLVDSPAGSRFHFGSSVYVGWGAWRHVPGERRMARARRGFCCFTSLINPKAARNVYLINGLMAAHFVYFVRI